MIEAAERIVAERGLTAMSLRVVQQESGQRNKSAAQYHFGSRDGLIEAVLVTRMAAVNERRRAMLDAIAPDPTGPALRPLVEALVRPVAEQTVLRPASCWARFVVQAGNDPAVAEVVRRRVEGEAYRELVERLVAAMAGVPEPLRRLRVERAVGVVFASLAAGEQVRDRGLASSVDQACRTEDLIDATVGLLAARASDAYPRRTRRPGHRRRTHRLRRDAPPGNLYPPELTAGRPTASRPISRPSTAFPSTTRPSTPCLFWR